MVVQYSTVDDETLILLVQNYRELYGMGTKLYEQVYDSNNTNIIRIIICWEEAAAFINNCPVFLCLLCTYRPVKANISMSNNI